MRTRICYPFILLIALLTTVSCENELPFSVKDNPPKLVMNALINADSLTNVLYLNFTGRGYATHVENARWKYVLTDSYQKVYVRSHPKRKEICNAVSIFPANLLPEM